MKSTADSRPASQVMRRMALPLAVAVVLLTAVIGAQTPAELVKQADRAFFKAEDMVRAEQLYRQVMAHPDVTAQQRCRAHRYACACVGRRGELAKAVDLQKVWLAAYPGHRKRHYTLFFQGLYLRQLGREKEAVVAWRTILAETPEPRIAERVRLELEPGRRAHSGRRRRPPIRYAAGRRLLPSGDRVGGYLVVNLAVTDAGFRAVAVAAARFHGGTVVDIDGVDIDGVDIDRGEMTALQRILRAHRPQTVLYVVQPEVLDVNLHRRLLMASTGIDEDIFADFTFGYLTGRDAEAVQRLWARTVRVHQHGLPGKTWHATSVASSIKAISYPGGIDAHARAAGFNGNQYYFSTNDTESDPLRTARTFLRELEPASVITMTGCGDPQGTWLFGDDRNRQRSKHWDYHPDKVGDDPTGEMPRITAAEFRKLRLQGPIVWTGVCHAGALRRIYVEGDIVSTFGRTRNVTLHVQKAEQSVCLALIDAGVTAFLCPIAANHGWSVSREVQFALGHGASLGETIKSTYDDVYLASRGDLKLGIQTAGERHQQPEYVMQGGGANRILIGDPALRPFQRSADPRETVAIENQTDHGFDVVVDWRKGLHPRGWDMYSWDRQRDWAVRVRVRIDGLVPADRRLEFTASVEGADADGQPLPYVMTHSEPESFHGRRYLHLQANAPRKSVSGKQVRAVFHVTFQYRWRR